MKEMHHYGDQWYSVKDQQDMWQVVTLEDAHVGWFSKEEYTYSFDTESHLHEFESFEDFGPFLSIQALTDALVARRHDTKRSEDWTAADWMTALVGEVGEAANFLKKVRRGDYPLHSALPDIAKELADVQCYLCLMADALGIDLTAATIAKFNEVSERIGSPDRI